MCHHVFCLSMVWNVTEVLLSLLFVGVAGEVCVRGRLLICAGGSGERK